MQELWEVVVEWFKSSGLDVAFDLGTIITVITSVVIGTKSFKKTKTAQIIAVSENQQMTKEYKETSEEIVNIKESIESLTNVTNKLIGLSMILLENAKIPADAKEKALNLFTASTESVKKVVEKVEDIVDNITESVKETIEKEKEQEKSTTTNNIHLNAIEYLINGQNTEQ